MLNGRSPAHNTTPLAAHTTARQCACMTRPQRPCWKYLCRGPTHLDFKSDWAFRAHAYCSENSRARARRLTLRKIGRKFGRCLRANQVANQPAQTADSVRTSLRTSSMRTGSKVRFRCYSGCYSHCYALSAKCGFSVNRPVNHPEKYGFAC